MYGDLCLTVCVITTAVVVYIPNAQTVHNFQLSRRLAICLYNESRLDSDSPLDTYRSESGEADRETAVSIHTHTRARSQSYGVAAADVRSTRSIVEGV